MKPVSAVWILAAWLAALCACPALESKLDGPYRNAELPEHVVAEFGKVTLFADHEHKDELGVPLYLVNRSAETVSWHTYAGAPGIVLEQFDEASQKWRQARRGKVSSAMCGLSFYTRPLLPGQHFKAIGYRSMGGREGKVRFRLGADLVSGEALGLWSESDVAQSYIDPLMLDQYPFAKALIHWHLEGDDPERPSAPLVLAELELMQVWEDGKVFRSFAKAYREELVRHTTKSGVSREEDLKAVDALLANPQADTIDPERFFKRCIAVLGQPRGTRHGSPEMEQEAAWRALDWLRARPGFGQQERWKAAFGLVESRTPKATEPELMDIGRFLLGNPMAYEFLSRDFFIQSARRYPALVEACSERLAGCGDWDALLAVADGRDIDFRLRVLYYFCVDRRVEEYAGGLRTTYDQRELEFWKTCIHDSPWKSVEIMGGSLRKNDGYYLEPALSLALRDQAEGFAEKAKKEPWPDDEGKLRMGLRQYVRVLGLYPFPKGMHMLHQFRKLEGVRPDGETDEQFGRRKEVAREARRQLLLAGWDPEEQPAE